MSSGAVTWRVGAVEITRVEDPGFDLTLSQDEETRKALAAAEWLAPWSVTEDLSLRIGSSATIVRTPSAVVLVDPFLAFDDVARLGPRLSALRNAGVEADDVDIVVNTHVDGMGVNVLADGSPTFPEASYILPTAELAALRRGDHPDLAGHPDTAGFVRLADEGLATGIASDERLLPGVWLRGSPGHAAGHLAVWIDSGGASAVIIGHLFLHPAQIADPTIVTGDHDPAALVSTRRSLLARCAADDTLLLGPLFAAPGGGHVRDDGYGGWKLEL